MSTAKSLTDDQITTIRSWADAGDSLSDIQRKLAEEMDVKITYLETRFLLEDHEIELQPEEKAPDPELEKLKRQEQGDGSSLADESAEGAADAGDDTRREGDGAGGGDVSVTIDQVQRPGAVVSGKANFSGGKSVSWWLDQMGRLGMDADDPNFRPSEDQMMAFQQELQRVVQQQGGL